MLATNAITWRILSAGWGILFFSPGVKWFPDGHRRLSRLVELEPHSLDPTLSPWLSYIQNGS